MGQMNALNFGIKRSPFEVTVAAAAAAAAATTTSTCGFV